MKKIVVFAVLLVFTVTMAVFSHEVVAGHTYEYEWTIINSITGAVISTGSGTTTPASGRGYRNIEHYIRSAVLGWNSRTRTVNGVRQRIIINLVGEEPCDD